MDVDHKQWLKEIVSIKAIGKKLNPLYVNASSGLSTNKNVKDKHA